jgi:alkylation response protein AidB-like acyl-CoA dehydrogenase
MRRTNRGKDNQTERSDEDVLVQALRAGGATSKAELDSIARVKNAEAQASRHRKPGPLDQCFMSTSLPLHLFQCLSDPGEWNASLAPGVGSPADVVDRTVQTILAHEAANTLFDPVHNKVTAEVRRDVGKAGFWRLFIKRPYGFGASHSVSLRAVTEVSAKADPSIGGLGNIQCLIGINGPLGQHGSQEQCDCFLLPLADGEIGSAFAGTEPCAGSWILNAKARGIVDGNVIRITCEEGKLFISNAWYGHHVALFFKIGDDFRVAIVKLPEQDTDKFRLVHYNILALEHIHNKGIIFKDFEVPLENLVKGDGLAMIWRDLDAGRAAVAAMVAARMRTVMREAVDWSKYRVSFDTVLEDMEGVQELLATMAARLVATDALARWSASVLDTEMSAAVSSIIAKVLTTDWLRDFTTELAVDTIGGRFTLYDSTVAKQIVDDLVTRTYEGPNRVLKKAGVDQVMKLFVKLLVTPYVQAAQRAGLDPFRLKLGSLNQLLATLRYLACHPVESFRLFRNGDAIAKLASFILKIEMPVLFDAEARRLRDVLSLLLQAGSLPDESLEDELLDYLEFALRTKRNWRKTSYRMALKYAERLKGEDIILSRRMFDPMSSFTAIATNVIAAAQAAQAKDWATVAATRLFLFIHRAEMEGDVEAMSSAKYRKLVAQVAKFVRDGEFRQLDGVPHNKPVMPYSRPVLNPQTEKGR